MHTSAYDASEPDVIGSDAADDDWKILDAVDILPLDYLPEQVPYGDRDLLARPIVNHACFVEPHHLQLKIQPFNNGGFEGTVKWVDLQKIADMQNAPRKLGTREKPEERSQESIERSRMRASQKVRHHVKSICANRLLTLTKRETAETGFSTPVEWAHYWARFCRVYKKYF